MKKSVTNVHLLVSSSSRLLIRWNILFLSVTAKPQCFSLNDTAKRSTGEEISIRNLKIGEKVLAIDQHDQIIPSEIIAIIFKNMLKLDIMVFRKDFVGKRFHIYFSSVWTDYCDGISDQSISFLLLWRARRRRHTNIQSMWKENGFFRRRNFSSLEGRCSIEMDSWIFDFSHYLTYTRVINFHWTKSFLYLLFLLSVFIPELATLPSDNSTSDWETVKYLINHFDSSSKRCNPNYYKSSTKIV